MNTFFNDLTIFFRQVNELSIMRKAAVYFVLVMVYFVGSFIIHLLSNPYTGQQSVAYMLPFFGYFVFGIPVLFIYIYAIQNAPQPIETTPIESAYIFRWYRILVILSTIVWIVPGVFILSSSIL